MNSFNIDVFSQALGEANGNTKACKLLKEAELSHLAALFPIIKKYELYQNGEFWNHTPISILCGLITHGDLFESIRQAYLQQKWGKGGKFHSEFTKFLLELDTVGTLEAIRTTKAFLNNQFWKALPLEAEICQNKEVKDILGSFEAARELYQPLLERIRAEIAKTEKALDWSFLELLILSAIYYEEALYIAHSRSTENPPFLLDNIVETINRITQQKWNSYEKEYIMDLRSGLERYAQTFQKLMENPDLWENFRTWMLTERLMTGVQLSLDYFCTYGCEIRPMNGKIQQEFPFQLLNELEQVRLRSALEEKAIPTSYENIDKAVAWLKGGDFTQVSKAQGPSSVSQWQFAGFPMRLQVGGKLIQPRFLLRFYEGLIENFRAPLLLFRMRFYQFLEEHPKYNDLNFIQKLSLFMELFYKHTNTIATFPFMISRQQLFQGSTKQSMSDADREMMHDTFSLLIREDERKMPAIDIFEQPLHQFGELLCFFEFTIPPAGQSGNLQNLIFKSWQRAEDNKAILQRSVDFENLVARCFRNTGFHTEERIVLRQEGKEFAEIDVVAWKGNEIMIVEAKSTYVRTSLCSNFAYRDKLKEAGVQLDRILLWIEHNRAEFLQRIGFPEGKGDPIIHTLIVSTAQDGNGENWGKGRHLKTSNFDFIHLLLNFKVIRQNYLIQAMITLLGSEALAVEVLKQLIKESSLVGEPKFKAFIQRLEKEAVEACLPTLNIWMDEDQVTPAFVLNSLKNKVIWGELSLEEEIQRTEKQSIEPPTEEDLRIGKMFEKDGDNMAQNGDNLAAVDAYRMALQKGNLKVAIKWMEALERQYSQLID